MSIIDKNNIQVTDTDIIDLHQTVNGESLFVVLDVASLDIRYYHDLKRKYEYDKEMLLKPFNGEVEFEIVGKLDPSELWQLTHGI